MGVDDHALPVQNSSPERRRRTHLPHPTMLNSTFRPTPAAASSGEGTPTQALNSLEFGDTGPAVADLDQALEQR
jgi:hypothetical protein